MTCCCDPGDLSERSSSFRVRLMNVERITPDGERVWMAHIPFANASSFRGLAVRSDDTFYAAGVPGFTGGLSLPNLYIYDGNGEEVDGFLVDSDETSLTDRKSLLAVRADSGDDWIALAAQLDGDNRWLIAGEPDATETYNHSIPYGFPDLLNIDYRRALVIDASGNAYIYYGKYNSGGLIYRWRANTDGELSSDQLDEGRGLAIGTNIAGYFGRTGSSTASVAHVNQANDTLLRIANSYVEWQDDTPVGLLGDRSLVPVRPASDWYLRSLDASMATEWETNISLGFTGRVEHIRVVGTDIYIACTNGLRKLDTDGNLLWSRGFFWDAFDTTRQVRGTARYIDVFSNGDLLVCGDRTSGFI